MALMLDVLFLFFVHATHVLAQEKGSDLIQPGSSLYSSKHPSSWASSSGHFEFGFYKKAYGFAIGIWIVGHPENTVVWTAANRDDPPVSTNATLIFTKDGDLLLQTGTHKETLINNSISLRAVDSASMLDTGNFVFYHQQMYVVWQSFKHPTDTILGGQNLLRGYTLSSSVSKSNHSTGKFYLTMQWDGNLVAYVNNSNADSSDSYWSSHTYQYQTESLNLNEKGSLALYGENLESRVIVLANSTRDGKNTSIYRATLDPDGIFRIYLHWYESNISSSTVTWQSLNDPCDVNGNCGLNSYCSSSRGIDFECYCYPGFSFIDEKNRFLGCSQNFTFDGCEWSKDSVMRYNVTTLANMSWVGDSYFVMHSDEDGCRKSCEEDCSCGAALYSNGNCQKYSLPLKYGRRKENISFTALIKLVLGSTRISRSPQSSPYPIVDEGNKSLISIMGLSLGSVSGVCLFIAISSILIYRHRVRSYRKLLENDNSGLTQQLALQIFSFSELDKATDGFKDELGRGIFGTVYKGVLPGDKDKKAIAVKKFEVHLGEKEFRGEMAVIGRTNHKHLVRLHGFCVEGSRKFLVYEYLSKGSLDSFLFNINERPDWKERVRIALDTAKGIHYLHEECEFCIIHCNIKPQNIFLDDSMTAKISDFGFGKLLRPKLNRSVQYLAPEWQKNASITAKVDVYSFGVILLELICCRSSLELQVSNVDEILLSSWVYNCLLSGELSRVVEGEEEVGNEKLERFVKVAIWCIQDDPTLRPSMKNVRLMLEGTMDVSFPPSPSPPLNNFPN